jgi:hypothetical protein
MAPWRVAHRDAVDVDVLREQPRVDRRAGVCDSAAHVPPARQHPQCIAHLGAQAALEVPVYGRGSAGCGAVMPGVAVDGLQQVPVDLGLATITWPGRPWPIPSALPAETACATTAMLSAWSSDMLVRLVLNSDSSVWQQRGDDARVSTGLVPLRAFARGGVDTPSTRSPIASGRSRRHREQDLRRTLLGCRS